MITAILRLQEVVEGIAVYRTYGKETSGVPTKLWIHTDPREDSITRHIEVTIKPIENPDK